MDTRACKPNIPLFNCLFCIICTVFDHASGYHNFYQGTEGSWRRKRSDLELYGADGSDGSVAWTAQLVRTAQMVWMVQMARMAQMAQMERTAQLDGAVGLANWACELGLTSFRG